jgi:hypothetical protein
MSTMEPGFVLRTSRFLRGRIPEASPPGRYEVFVIVTREGALRKSQLVAGDIDLVESAMFEVCKVCP